jgi:hypothetical protein
MDMDELFDEFDKFANEGAEKLSPREYAALRDMVPQMVYYYIRTGVVKAETCICGRKVVDVARTDEALQAHKKASGKRLPSD